MALLDGLTTPTPNQQAPGYVQDALNKPFAFSNTQAPLNPGQLQQQAADTAYQSATRYLDPQFARQQSGLESQLANQGITRGSEAWNNATNQFNENKNQAYDQARSQAYTQGLGGANQALNTMFQQSSLDTAKQNAQTMADAMKTQGMYGLGAGLLGSSTGQSALKSLGGSLGSGLGSLLSSGGSSLMSGLGGLFGGGSSAALPDWAAGITDPQTLEALGLSGGGGSSMAPQFNVVGNSGVNQLAETMQGRSAQAPIQAYVVANDVTTAQGLNRNIVTNASLG